MARTKSLRPAQPVQFVRVSEQIIKADIPARIKEARVAAGMSQPQLAGAIDVTLSALTNYEKDRVPWEKLSQIAEATNCDVRWLLFGASFQDPLLDIQAKLEHLATVLLEQGLVEADEKGKRSGSGRGADRAGSSP
jgi:transcriptional regulator with XRE-family HTH domain